MKARDPVCGMTVDTEHATASGEFEGQRVYFCSARCREQYAAGLAKH